MYTALSPLRCSQWQRLKGLGDKARLKAYEGLHQSVRDYVQGMASSEQPNESQEDAQKRLLRYGMLMGVRVPV